MTLNACHSGAGRSPAHWCMKYSVYSVKRAGTTLAVFRGHHVDNEYAMDADRHSAGRSGHKCRKSRASARHQSLLICRACETTNYRPSHFP